MSYKDGMITLAPEVTIALQLASKVARLCEQYRVISREKSKGHEGEWAEGYRYALAEAANDLKGLLAPTKEESE